MNVYPQSTPSPTAESPTFGAAEGDESIIFESYLYKIPPLKSILAKWSKKWFILRRRDISDPTSIELAYYKEISRRDKKTIIDLSKIVGIRPTGKIGSNDHIFAIEMEHKKYILKAPDQNTKNIWLAKLCEYCGQGPLYHVTVPYQPPTTVYNEAILKLSTEKEVSILNPSNSEALLTIQYSEVRRLGYMDNYNNDIIWFETCKNSMSDRFFFFVISSGVDVAKQIVQELKSTIQSQTSSLLILEDSSGLDLSYIAKEHYGCSEFSVDSRAQILQTGLRHLPHAWRRFMPTTTTTTTTPIERQRSESIHSSTPSTLEASMGSNSGGASPVMGGGVSLEEFGRRKSKSTRVAPTGPIGRRPTLDKFVRHNSIDRQNSGPLFERQGSTVSFDRKASATSFDRKASVTSFDRTSGSTSSSSERRGSLFDRKASNASFDHSLDSCDMASPSPLPEEIINDGHFSSGSGSDVFDSTPLSSVHERHEGTAIKRQLSIQSSTSSHTSSSSTNSLSRSPDTPREELASSDTFNFDTSAATAGPNFLCAAAPTVPPRSVVSLQQDGYFTSKMATAH